MKYLTIIMIVVLFSGCREFYDEEFDEVNASTSELQDRTYTTDLVATDASITDLTGNAEVVVENGSVKVSLDVTGVPSNLLQLHFGYVAADCSALSFSIPNEVGTPRNFSLSEDSSVESLLFDLRSSGAIPSDGNIDLEGMSFVVKAFSNFSGLSSAAGTTSFTIACGRLDVSSTDNTFESDEAPEEVQ